MNEEPNMATKRTSRRPGASAVEFALTAPLVFLLFFGSFEFSRMNMIRHTADIAAYEGAREGIVAGATSDDVRDRVTDLLSTVGVREAVITVTPAIIERSAREVRVDVDVPIAPNSWITPRFFGDLHVQATSTLAREGFTSPRT
jgi:Flp pilus assembly protein TadG